MLARDLYRSHPDRVRDMLAQRHTEAPFDRLLEVDAAWREVLVEVEELKAHLAELLEAALASGLRGWAETDVGGLADAAARGLRFVSASVGVEADLGLVRTRLR